MGEIKKLIYDRLIDPVADRGSNRIRVQRAPNNELTIHFRNLKIVLHKEEEIQDWKKGFKIALEKFEKEDYLKDDI